MLSNTVNSKQRIDHSGKTGKTNVNEDYILRKVSAALSGMQYGEIVIKVEKGTPVYIDRHERVRIG